MRSGEKQHLEDARIAIYQSFFEGALDANAATEKLLALDVEARLREDEDAPLDAPGTEILPLFTHSYG